MALRPMEKHYAKLTDENKMQGEQSALPFISRYYTLNVMPQLSQCTSSPTTKCPLIGAPQLGQR